MAQKVHDHFAKQYLAYILDKKGKSEISYEIKKTSFQVDVVFTPIAELADFPALGLLGQMTGDECFLEVFWKQPQKQGIRTCLTKLFLVHNNLHNQAKSQKKSLPEEILPHLWIITTSASNALLNSCYAKQIQPTWCEGVYFFADILKTGLIVINQLPSTPETLWLRLLGKQKIRAKAIQELIALPADNALRNPVLKLVYNYLKAIDQKSQKTQEDKELFMELSPAYYQWEKETIDKGRLEERRGFVENLLKIRFSLSSEAIAELIEPLLKLSPAESTRLLLQSSYEEVLKKFVK